jgi:hypothetical protein
VDRHVDEDAPQPFDELGLVRGRAVAVGDAKQLDGADAARVDVPLGGEEVRVEATLEAHLEANSGRPSRAHRTLRARRLQRKRLLAEDMQSRRRGRFDQPGVARRGNGDDDRGHTRLTEGVLRPGRPSDAQLGRGCLSELGDLVDHQHQLGAGDVSCEIPSVHAADRSEADHREADHRGECRPPPPRSQSADRLIRRTSLFAPIGGCPPPR